MSRFLVTGAAGFIGCNLVEALLNAGHTVIGLDNLSNGFQDNIDFLGSHPQRSQYTFIKGDITDFDACKHACNSVEFVLHHAALGSVPKSIEQPELYNRINMDGTFNMMKAAKQAGVKRFVYASSSSVYGDSPELPKVETMAPQPQSPYAINKITNEYYGKLFSEVYGLPTIGLRYFNVFGPRQNPNSDYAAAIPKFITSFLSNTSPIIHGDGEQTRDFVYISNVAHANLKACLAPSHACGKAYNIGCGEKISINDLVYTIKALLDSSIEITYSDTRKGDVRDSVADIRLAMKELKLDTFISLREGLAKTIEWYKQTN